VREGGREGGFKVPEKTPPGPCSRPGSDKRAIKMTWAYDKRIMTAKEREKVRRIRRKKTATGEMMEGETKEGKEGGRKGGREGSTHQTQDILGIYPLVLLLSHPLGNAGQLVFPRKKPTVHELLDQAHLAWREEGSE